MSKPKKENQWEEDDISFQSPSMTEAEKLENWSAFGAYRKQAKGKVLDKDRLRLRFLRLKFRMNEYLNAQQSDYRFYSFLVSYMKCFNLSGKTFADEINITPSELSLILHGHRDPNRRIMMRLEIHSNYNFPAPLWYEVLAKEKALELKDDRALRKEEEAVVRPKIKVVI